MTAFNSEPALPDEPKTSQGGEKAEPIGSLLAQMKKTIPVLFGLSGSDPRVLKEKLLEQVKKLVKNPGQYSEDLMDSLFGTGADGISREADAEKKGKFSFSMDLPDPVRMPDVFSVAYHRRDEKKKDVVTLLERDGEGNIRYLDAGKECVFVRMEEGFRRYPVLPERQGFGKWDGVLLSARSVRGLTEHFWNCADQTFIKWLGVELKEKKVCLGRPCGLYHAQPGTITFTYQCDMLIDDETGICLCYTADKLLKGAVFSNTEDKRLSIGIGDYRLGGTEMDFSCTRFETKDISFALPAD